MIGDYTFREVDSTLVLKVLKPVWERTPETGRRLRSRIERIFDWAKPLKLYDGENPARLELLKNHLPKMKATTHHKALHYNDLPAFTADLQTRDGIAARALEFTILTAARTGETIGARWSEIDLDARCWTVPADRIKAGKEHRVPLSDRAVAILESLPRSEASDFVFIGTATEKAVGPKVNQLSLSPPCQ